MNYLAHIYLSGENNEVKIGNFIADFVQGKSYKSLPEDIQKGIFLHRHIDDYTDNHRIFKTSKKRLFKEFRHYSAVIVDMFYDHFLAKNFARYSDIPLKDYSFKFYDLLEEYQDILPKTVVRLIPIIKQYDWLSSYAEIEKLTSILNQMNNRTAYATELHKSVHNLRKDYSLFENEFFEFFEKLQQEVEKKKVELEIC